nr:5-bromo-4-chloroindolyl phosphate hydrolysis family protein [uncultured Faecalimonas sp.]
MVDDAMRSMNFSKLNQDISRTVNQALDEARRQFGGYSDTDFLPHVDPHSKYDRESQSEGQRQQQNGSGQRPFGQGFRSTETVQPGAGKREQRSVTEIKVQPVGKVSGILMIVFGSIGLGFAGVMELILLVASLFTGRLNLLGISLVVQIPILIFALALLWKGIANRKGYKKMLRCMEILNGRVFCQIEEMAAKMNLSEKEMLKELKKMIRRGAFPQGHIDEQGTCLMLDDRSYQQYLQAQRSWKQRQEAEKEEKQRQEAQKKEQKREPKKEAREISPEIQAMVQEGGRYITSLREANDAIFGEVISAKLDKLELIISKIFESVIRHPEQAGEMKKFMEYYLPTTLKLVNTYREFDGLPVKGENITTAMTEIERTLDTIIVAFEKLLDDLFQDTAFDVSADISVLEAMFAREGYKESDF